MGVSICGFGFKRVYLDIFGVECLKPKLKLKPTCIVFGCLLADARTLNNHLCAQAVLSNV